MSILSRSSALPRSFAVRALATLAVAAGIAAATPEPARAGSIGIIITDGDHRDHRSHRGGDWRRDRGDDRRHWRGDRHRHHRRHGPPPWAYNHHHHHRPHWQQYRPYVRTCHVVWSAWHGGYVRVCR